MNMFSTKTWVVAMMATLAAPAAMASVPWIGTANYLNAPGAQSDEALVGPFDTYDFGGGIGLIKPDTTVAVGNTFTGWFQTYVNSHLLGGVGLNVPSLNTSGSGSGFELTVVSQFTGTYTSLSGGLFGFTINAGSASLRFDSTPDYSFASDSGFNDGAAILAGSIVGGSGLVNTTIGYGFEVVSLDMSGAFSLVDSNVYNPSAINGGEALFSITMNTPFVNAPVINQMLQGSQSVLGNSVSGGQLFELDGNLKLTQVSVPSALWLFVTGIASLVSIRRKMA